MINRLSQVEELLLLENLTLPRSERTTWHEHVPVQIVRWDGGMLELAYHIDNTGRTIGWTILTVDGRKVVGKTDRLAFAHEQDARDAFHQQCLQHATEIARYALRG